MEAFARRIIFEEEILYWIIFYALSSLVLYGALDSHVLKYKNEKTKALKFGIVFVNLIFFYLLWTPNILGATKAKLIFILMCFLMGGYVSRRFWKIHKDYGKISIYIFVMILIFGFVLLTIFEKGEIILEYPNVYPITLIDEVDKSILCYNSYKAISLL